MIKKRCSCARLDNELLSKYNGVVTSALQTTKEVCFTKYPIFLASCYNEARTFNEDNFTEVKAKAHEVHSIGASALFSRNLAVHQILKAKYMSIPVHIHLLLWWLLNRSCNSWNAAVYPVISLNPLSRYTAVVGFT